jgi:hypothetical protein
MTEETTQFEQVSLDDLNHFWLPNGAPCFLANREDICDQVEGLGFQIYYLVANHETVSSQTNKNNNNNNKNTNNSYTYQQIKYTGRLLKVVKNIVGRSVGVSNEDFNKDLLSFKEEAEYHLPPIPRAMVEKMDEFFRLVHAQHGTESIVILTFDTTKEGSDGWGILVPEQTNTAAHCKYDPDSIAGLKDDHVLIVGSVHSHPEMSAYASGTDHEDQADFDGLHITYGWQKSVSNGMTQYHAELQMGGSNYILDIDDVFESFKMEKDPDPEVVEWTDKVKKFQAPALGAYNPTTPYQTTYYNAGTTHTAGHGITNPNYAGYDTQRFTQKRTQNIPDEILNGISYNAVLIAEIDTSEHGRMLCPSCGLSLFRNEIYLGSSCPSCDIPIVSIGMHIDNIIKSVHGFQNKRGRNISVPYYLWSKSSGNGKNHTVLLIKPELSSISSIKGDDNLKADIYDDGDQVRIATPDDDDSDLQMDLRKEYEDKLFQAYDNGEIQVEEYTDLAFELELWATHTWCCSTELLGNVDSCDCAVMVTDEDASEYDDFCSKNNLVVYLPDTDCHSCAYYYTGGCPSYRESVVDFSRNKNRSYDVIVDNIEQNLNLSGCLKWQGYESLDSQIEKEDMESYDNAH